MVPDSTPIYDVHRTYEENYAEGPFGEFAALGAQASALGARTAPLEATATSALGSQVSPLETPTPFDTDTRHYSFFGQSVRTPFGIPAGPLLNERFTTAAFRAGFDIATYKTVRSRAWACNPFPNVLSVHPASGELTAGAPETVDGVLADDQFGSPETISISNSFGVPSQSPDVWQPDMQRAIQNAGPGQLLLASFQGSRTPEMSEEQYIADHVTTARLALETGAKVLEMNTSCPNEGKGRLLCHNPELVGRITEAVKNEIGDTPLIIKLAFMPDDADVERMMQNTVLRQSVQGFATINTISARLVNARGEQALPGEGRETSGVCGAAIRHAGLEMVERVIRVQRNLGIADDDFAVIGVGGVTSARDVQDYLSLGARAVMSATGAMWNARLGQDVRAALR
ncbi:tRNA-dihydrouridine synthase [Alloscardovia macacae]|nr:tRNA-dihydrouridine synthase [Alloscardovia macacae]